MRGKVRMLAGMFVVAGLFAMPAHAQARIKIHRIQFDPPGSDTGGNINEEYVVVRNTGSGRVALTDWTLRDVASHVFRFPTFRLGAGAKVTIHTGRGSNTRRHLYWRSGSYIWNNDGDTAILRRASGALADRCGYSGAGSAVFC